ncbi:D-alanyl-D-alanine carboxypeptidase [Rhodococcus rhodochrous J3]|uniref:Beta-lactamase family protein n=3 Tax=Rhodococcus rhodochrous TaxID=1829 RepID=A0AA47AE11_RHORH|nr:serine hydrolase domain-containing protein [Rhodococcus rhodochrous]AYA26193.1 class A beta-lactamase-related serine hydrolase [Rhodococcus rhodochrous]MBF4481701.1 beta-lactamase family protein [Rhodococcus rhodochrous]MCB8911874.1 beta-lactamase family protein [Rhodococcus rhodochrous]MCD2095694.1 beta-lactamase family protein [Rhodococcus rhodochrous]MCD2119872.1 beta-lactamase family protein [Rhodococcus rhodochrous]
MNRSASARSLRAAGAAVAVAMIVGACSGSDDDSSPTEGTSPPGTAAGVSATDTAVNPVDQARLEQVLEQTAQEFLVPGAAALLRTPSGTVTATYGTTERDGGDPVSLDDHVRVGSNTKTWTATVILQQVQDGNLALSDPVSKHRPDVPNGDAITIEQLLNMRSGLYNYTETPEFNQAMDDDPERVWQPEELLDLAFANPPYFPPGEGYHYSNTNYVLLGLIAEQLDGRPLAQIFDERLFRSTGLTRTSLPGPSDTSLPSPYAHGYFYGTNMLTLTDPALPPEMQAEARDGTLEPTDVTRMNPSWAWAAGGGISTAEDLATWVEALTGGDLLDADLQQQRMTTMQSTDPANPDAPSYGWGIAKMGPMYGHTGELPGYNSFMGSDPDNGVTLIVWTDLAPGVDGRDPASTAAKSLMEEMYPS